MNLSLSKLPWHAQIGAFVVVCLGAVFGFWKFYVSEVQADIALRQTRLTALRADVDRGVATARQLPQFEEQVNKLEQRLESLRQVLPEEKDVADILRRIQGLATKSNLTIQRFQPGKVVQQKLYAEIPYKLQAEGTVPQPRLLLRSDQQISANHQHRRYRVEGKVAGRTERHDYRGFGGDHVRAARGAGWSGQGRRGAEAAVARKVDR